MMSRRVSESSWLHWQFSRPIALLVLTLFAACLAVKDASAQPAFVAHRSHVDQMLYLTGVTRDALVHELAYQLHAVYLEEAQNTIEAEQMRLRAMRPVSIEDERAVKRFYTEREQIVNDFAQRQRELRARFATDLSALATSEPEPLLSFIERQAQLALSIGWTGVHVDVLVPWMESGQPSSCPAFRAVYEDYAARLKTCLDSRDAYRAGEYREGLQNPIRAAIRLDSEAKRIHDEYARRLAEGLEDVDRLRFEDNFLSRRHGAYFGNTRADELLKLLLVDSEDLSPELLELRARLHAVNWGCVDADERVREAQFLRNDVTPLKRYRARVRAERDKVARSLATELETIVEERRVP